ncbi:hypothetical protein ACJWDR_29020 [Streptomyces tauricus]|uniref:hypothetical protein n=1 Tax=Streptomyces tauricus TaxID=68274 RepID=UPI00387EEEC6
MTSPAQELAAAAAKLRALADAARTDGHGRDISTWTSHHASTRDARLHGPDRVDIIRGGSSGPHGRGIRPHLHPPVADYIAAMQPNVGVALAQWLEAEAFQALHNGQGPNAHHALAVARQILGSTDG